MIDLKEIPEIFILDLTNIIITDNINSDYSKKRVKYVIDGDTIVVNGNKKIRLSAINTKEVSPLPEKYGIYTKKIVKKLIQCKDVILFKDDSENKDRYGRYLRFVYIKINDQYILLQYILIKLGLASLYLNKATSKFYKHLIYAEKNSIKNKCGMYSENFFDPYYDYENKRPKTEVVLLNVGDKFIRPTNYLYRDYTLTNEEVYIPVGIFKLYKKDITKYCKINNLNYKKSYFFI